MLLYPTAIAEAEAKEEGAVQEEETNSGVQFRGGDVSRAVHEELEEGVLGRLYTVRLENRIAMEGHRVTGSRHENPPRPIIDAFTWPGRGRWRRDREGTNGRGILGYNGSAVERSDNHGSGTVEAS